jgi:hypothetical protein
LPRCEREETLGKAALRWFATKSLQTVASQPSYAPMLHDIWTLRVRSETVFSNTFNWAFLSVRGAINRWQANDPEVEPRKK